MILLYDFIRSIGGSILQIVRISIVSLIFSVAVISCQSFIEVEPPATSMTAESIFSNDASAASVMNGIYSDMNQNFLAFSTTLGFTSLSTIPELSGDNLVLNQATDANFLAFYRNNLISLANSSSRNIHFWAFLYNFIYRSNAVIEGVKGNEKLSVQALKQLHGEALFIRALLHFYLVNLYGEIPILTTTNFLLTSQVKREPVEDVYQQIIKDLVESQQLLGDDYVDSSTIKVSNERTRPNKSAATALLARAYLYQKDYENADKQASILLDNNERHQLLPISDVFLKNSHETIWALQPVRAGENTQEARFYMMSSLGPSFLNPVSLSPHLLDVFSDNDERKANWIKSITVNGKTYYYPTKYKQNVFNAPVTEYSVVLRLAEQYLIRAEARYHLGQSDAAIADLNQIRNRAGLINYTANEVSLGTAILKERQLEFFTEFGHRWFDLKRTEKVNEVMQVDGTRKGGNWESNWQFYPIPVSELINNQAIHQNPGYPQ